MRHFSGTDALRASAIHFQKHGTYCLAPYGTSDYMDFWKEEFRRCKEGFSANGISITGDHYHYLNYCPIKRVFIDTIDGVKKLRSRDADLEFPDFRDGNYQFFWCKQIALEGIDNPDFYSSLGLGVSIPDLSGGKNLWVIKARQKGFSFMNASLLANRYFHVKNSLSATTAFEKKYVNSSMGMFEEYMNFQNQHCAWAKPALVSKRGEHYLSGRKVIDEFTGIETVQGYKSEVLGYTLKDNPDALRGKTKALILIEEVGTFKTNLKETLAAMEPITKSGDFKTGMIIGFGTGGGDSTSWADAKDVFYNPELYNMLIFENDWEAGFSNKSCGFFYPNYLAKEGYMDEDGNSDIEEAKRTDEIERAKKKKAAKNMRDYALYVMEYAHTPSEAFMQAGGNLFPQAELSAWLSELETTKQAEDAAYIGELVPQENNPSKLKWVPSEMAEPIRKFPLGKEKSRGCIVIWEMPERNEDGSVPDGVYIAGTDPYAQDESTGDSIGSTLIYKQFVNMGKTYNWIVAEYTGRPDTAEDYFEELRKLLTFYNCKTLHENMDKNLKNYFQNKGSLHLLRSQPTDYIKSIMPGSRVERTFGIHMTPDLKSTGDQLIKSWLLEERGDGTKNLHTIYSIPLLQELISYDPDPKKNFDRVSALRCLMFHKTANFFFHKKPDERPKDSFWSKNFFGN
jgi:hypothetical protein